MQNIFLHLFILVSISSVYLLFFTCIEAYPSNALCMHYLYFERKDRKVTPRRRAGDAKVDAGKLIFNRKRLKLIGFRTSSSSTAARHCCAVPPFFPLFLFKQGSFACLQIQRRESEKTCRARNSQSKHTDDGLMIMVMS